MNYILVEKEPIPEPDTVKFAQWYETANRQIGYTVLNRRNRIYVSTVFLGIDHNFGMFDRPVLFETMIFGTSLDQFQRRYTDWESAKKGHAEAVFRARQARQIRNQLSFRKSRKRLLKLHQKFLKRRILART